MARTSLKRTEVEMGDRAGAVERPAGTGEAEERKSTEARAEQGPAAEQKKRCSKCGEWKDRSEFSRHKKAKDGLFWQCKKCKHRIEAEWRRNKAKESVPTGALAAIADSTAAAGVAEARFLPGEIVTECYPEHILVLDFSEHVDALERLRELAKSELRTPGAQLLYWFTRGKIAG